jgi:hypothetical protein
MTGDHANLNFKQSRTGPDGQLLPDEYTETRHVGNLFTVGPAILWFPFLLIAHLAVLLLNLFGKQIAADGFSFPYLLAMAFGTATYADDFFTRPSLINLRGVQSFQLNLAVRGFDRSVHSLIETDHASLPATRSGQMSVFWRCLFPMGQLW